MRSYQKRKKCSLSLSLPPHSLEMNFNQKESHFDPKKQCDVKIFSISHYPHDHPFFRFLKITKVIG